VLHDSVSALLWGAKVICLRTALKERGGQNQSSSLQPARAGGGEKRGGVVGGGGAVQLL
jgi:hypothetical protein